MTRPARRRASSLLLFSLAIVVAAALAVPATAAATLQTRITTILAAHGFAGGASGTRVYDLSTHRLLYSRHPGTTLAPASNEKLVTSATALARWGADHRFTTQLYTTGTLDADGVLHGRLYLKGRGDPTLSTAWFQRNVLHLRTSNLQDFVTALKNAGVKKVAGRVVGDEGYFDKARTVGWWKPGMADDCGPLSALSLNEGVGAKGNRVSNPPMWVVTKLTQLLRSSDIAVTRGPMLGVTPKSATLAYTERSAPLGKILARLNKPSDNFIAEMLTKGLGAAFGGAPTTAAGCRVETTFLVKRGLKASSFRLTDGSGLSYYDRLTAAGVTRLLRAMAERKDWATYWGSLAVAGYDGTLKDRMRGTLAARNLHGKTGTLNIASCLSGYVTSANGHRLVFSMLMNAGWIDVGAAHAAQDAIGALLARTKPAGAIVWTPPVTTTETPLATPPATPAAAASAVSP